MGQRLSILHANGSLAYPGGWGLDQAQYYLINRLAGKEGKVKYSLIPHEFGYRAWDFMVLHMSERHIITVPFLHIYPGGGSTIQLFTKNDRGGQSFLKSRKRQHQRSLILDKLPEMDLDTVDFGRMQASFDDGSLKVEME